MSPTTVATRRPVITAWSAVSPFGVGRAAFNAGMAERRSTAAPLDPELGPMPHETACLVPGFDVRAQLGKKGTRSMDRVTGLTVTAVGQLLDEAERNRRVGTGEEAAFVLGTTTGSAQSMMDFTRESLTGDKPFFVDPARFPNTVMNCAAGQSAIWYQLKGPNTTVAGGRSAGLHALNYARRLLSTGRARAVLCGSAEEFTPARAWLEHRSAERETAGAALGEGGAVLLVEPAGGEDQPVLAEVLAVELGVELDGDTRGALARTLRRALQRAEVTPDEVSAVACSGAPGAAGEAELDAVNEALGGSGADSARITHLPAELIGDTGAAATTLGIATLLSEAERAPSGDRIGLITSVDRAGSVGCAVLRLR
ncbi:3-oxoacyl-[acyl-carrier-protein] synthase II [Streptomyces zhaozhouensis]|uniref:3-oxoacyl-[acyl-carrier-protein] synthase II n=1 Tax=Streptomyces zhaozhouensis TaxID=1300267 RepID=A0A286DV92_9ACTN|nr:beta-ketoacyl synthase N-terminal-like domain-containing protein [Streptomyces zhaozhouensis]SOD62587.1 3-oxoacyl-[acyl-carrier-protein] synthase II [Streptomyces zhaozhouensis]